MRFVRIELELMLHLCNFFVNHLRIPLILSFALLIGIGFAAPLSGSKTDTHPALLLSQPLTVRWRYQSDTLNLTPAFDTERIYLPIAGGTIVCLKAKDGQLCWRSEMGGELSASPIADEQMIYVASEVASGSASTASPGGALRALGREGGVTQWMTPLVKPLKGSLAIRGEKLFAGGVDGRAYAFDKRTGGVFWSIPFSAPFGGQPVSDGARVYFGSDDGSMVALEESTGKLLWRFKTKGVIRGPVAVGNGRVFFGSADGYVYCVTADKGHLVWRSRTGGGVEAVTLAGDSLLAASLDNFAYLFDAKGGRMWKKQLPGRISSQPLTVKEAALFMPLSSSVAVVLALRDGKQVNLLATGDEITSSAAPVVVGDALIVTTEHGMLAFAPPSATSATTSKPSP